MNFVQQASHYMYVFVVTKRYVMQQKDGVYFWKCESFHYELNVTVLFFGRRNLLEAALDFVKPVIFKMRREVEEDILLLVSHVDDALKVFCVHSVLYVVLVDVFVMFWIDIAHEEDVDILLKRRRNVDPTVRCDDEIGVYVPTHGH